MKAPVLLSLAFLALQPERPLFRLLDINQGESAEVAFSEWNDRAGAVAGTQRGG